jgi:hypothetical protein
MAHPDKATHFHVHSLAAGPDGSLQTLTPQRVDLDAASGQRTSTAHDFERDCGRHRR